MVLGGLQVDRHIIHNHSAANRSTHDVVDKLYSVNFSWLEVDYKCKLWGQDYPKCTHLQVPANTDINNRKRYYKHPNSKLFKEGNYNFLIDH